MKNMGQILSEHKLEIDRHLAAIADVLSEAGARDPVSSLRLEIPGFRVWSLRWERGA